MTEPYITLTLALTMLASIAIVSLSALRGWREWLALKRAELQQDRVESAMPSTGSRIEVADMKERIRKLEAIAAGVDL